MSGDLWAGCSGAQQAQLRRYQVLLLGLNRKINLVSRETVALFEERHLQHVLSFALRTFPPGSTVVDWGTGGGLPAIPLAILFPEVTVHAVDAVGKKIQAVQLMARRLGLTNLKAWHGRAERWPGQAHFSVSRATAPLATLWQWHQQAADPDVPACDAPCWPPGLICLKGGDLYLEIKDLIDEFPGLEVERIALADHLSAPFFATKEIVAVRQGGGG